MGDDGDSQDVARRTDEALRGLSSLSRTCGVIPQELKATLAALFRGLLDLHSGSIAPSSQINARLQGLHGDLVASLHEEGLKDSCQGAPQRPPSLQEYILDRLLRDDHLFFRYIDGAPGFQVGRELYEIMESDLAALESLARADVSGWVEALARHDGAESRDPPRHAVDLASEPGEDLRPWDISRQREHLKRRFRDQRGWASLVEELADFVNLHGCGAYQGTPAFRLESTSGDIRLMPVGDFAAFDLNWLEGNEKRIDVLERNTRNLLDGFKAHNALIWGPRGCGKSSLIRGLVTRYYDSGLRAIEIQPQHWGCLRQLYALVRDRREFFVGVLDNISLERGDPSSQSLASVLDGGLETQPPNIVFYGTSNFKDLVDREGQRPQGLSPHGTSSMTADGDGALNPAAGGRRQPYDPQQFERLDGLRALDDRFALKVFMNSPAKSECEHMVISYARRAGIEIDEEELLAAFQIWRMRHNHDLVGGRTARDFIVDAYPGFARQTAGRGDMAPTSRSTQSAGLT